MTLTDKINKIEKYLNKELELTETALGATAVDMQRMKTTAEDYNEAWYSMASVSVMKHHLQSLKDIITDGNAKKAESFIRFTAYQIEQFTDADMLERDAKSEDVVLDGKITLYHIFKAFVNVLDAE